MPTRHGRVGSNGGVVGGYLDVVFIPCVLAVPARHVWVMEYDVDYSGSWHDFFSQFARVNADVLTTTLAHESDYPDWNWWAEASAPDWVDRADFVRGFHPLMRLSRRFAHRYAVMMADSSWRGHYEFTIPTAAVASGSSIEDLGGLGRFTPEGRAINYVNEPSNLKLSPGTYVWRPARGKYFHEAPASFAEANQLYHPIKPDIAAWDTKPSVCSS
jgi:hypothetical protein